MTDYCYVREYISVMRQGGETVACAREPAIARHRVAIGVASAQSQKFDPRTKYVRLYADVACHFLIDADPTATTDDGPLGATMPEYFEVAGEDKLAVLLKS